MDQRGNSLILWPILGFLVAASFGVGLISMAAFDDSDEDPAAQATTQTSDNVLEVGLGDLFLEPANLTAVEGPLTINVTNAGKTEHNFAIVGMEKTEMIPPGGKGTLKIDSIEAGTYDILCEVPGHAEGGMKGTLTVTEASEGGAAAPAGGHDEHSTTMSPEEMVKHDAAVTGSFPAKTKGVGGQVLEPTVRADGTKVYELTASEVKWETEPGTFMEAYAYNGQVPGPTLSPELGDNVEIVLHNELPEPTTIHYHGMTVPADMDGVPVISQDPVMPGESFTYKFPIRNTGTNMYHSHFNAQKQVPMGLLGAMNVPDARDPKVDVDANMIVNDGALGFTLNGKGFPATQPIVANHGDLIRIRYMNEGMLTHPMHLHGMPQKVFAIDGHRVRPYTADTINVAPGQRIDVLVKATEPGTWAFHCHILNHAEGPDGMFGMVTAMVVQ